MLKRGWLAVRVSFNKHIKFANSCIVSIALVLTTVSPMAIAEAANVTSNPENAAGGGPSKRTR